MMLKILLLFNGMCLISAISMRPHWQSGMAPVFLISSYKGYVRWSMRRQRLSASCTAAVVMSSADATCQMVVQQEEGHQKKAYDLQRTLALGLFGFGYYGGPCKSLYLLMDRWIGTAATIRNMAMKTFFDVYVHTPFILVPCYYATTNAFKGISFRDTRKQLRQEWATASFCSAVFWTPAQMINFRSIPQHSKILYISLLSFVDKTGLSWLSNRADNSRDQPSS